MLLDIRNVGLMSYRQCLDLQMELWEQRTAGTIPNTVLLVEHPSVITLGARESENRLLVDEEKLGREGIDIVRIRRGGGTTAHNPGQAVIYPIIRLKSLGLGVPEYVRQLEQIGMDLLGEYGVNAGRREGYPGLWIGERKIASIGVQVKKWTTLHGIAINICNDLSVFDYIVPCGIDGVEMISLEKIVAREVEMREIFDKLSLYCRKYWQDRKHNK